MLNYSALTARNIIRNGGKNNKGRHYSNKDFALDAYGHMLPGLQEAAAAESFKINKVISLNQTRRLITWNLKLNMVPLPGLEPGHVV